MPKPSLTHQLVDTEAGLDALEADWRRLLALDTGAGLFNGWETNRLWWRHYGVAGRLRVLVLSADARVVAIAPFHLGDSRLLGLPQIRTLRLIGRGGDTAPDDLDLIADPAWAEAAAARVCDWLVQQREARRWLLEDLPADGALTRALLDRFADRTMRRTPQLRRVAELPDGIDAWRAGLSRNSRKHLSRRRRRAEAAGRLDYRLADAASLHAEDFERLVELHRQRRVALSTAQGAVSASFATPRYLAYHRELCTSLAQAGRLRFGVLELDGRPIGIEYAARHGDTLVFLQTGFDPSFTHLSPGHLLMSHLIEQGIEEGVKRLDLLKGDYDYKVSYAPDERLSVSLDMARSRHTARAVRWADRLRRRLQRAIATASGRQEPLNAAPAPAPDAPDGRP